MTGDWSLVLQGEFFRIPNKQILLFMANSFFEELLLQVENGKKQTPKVFNPDNPVQAEGAARGRDAACHVSTTGTPRSSTPCGVENGGGGILPRAAFRFAPLARGYPNQSPSDLLFTKQDTDSKIIAPQKKN
jgi:hypothetical protein